MRLPTFGLYLDPWLGRNRTSKIKEGEDGRAAGQQQEGSQAGGSVVEGSGVDACQGCSVRERRRSFWIDATPSRDTEVIGGV